MFLPFKNANVGLELVKMMKGDRTKSWECINILSDFISYSAQSKCCQCFWVSHENNVLAHRLSVMGWSNLNFNLVIQEGIT